MPNALLLHKLLGDFNSASNCGWLLFVSDENCAEAFAKFSGSFPADNLVVVKFAENLPFRGNLAVLVELLLKPHGYAAVKAKPINYRSSLPDV